GLSLFAILSAWRRWGPGIRRLLGISFDRIVRWEFWPAWLFYSPVVAICFWLGLRYRGLSLPTVANLNQKNGGIVGESKIGIDQVSAPLVLQRYVEGPEEAGIFYYRFPKEQKGHILGITRKQFPLLVGDGVHSIRELIEADSRARLIAQTYLERFASVVDQILPQGESLRLVEAGNHCQGCIFKEGEDLYSEELRNAFDQISQKLPGFYIGRYDVRYRSDDELRAGKEFQIIELNGAASEATNIYDKGNSLWSAYNTLYRQWKLVFQIGAANRSRGHRPVSPLAVIRDWMEFSRQAMEYPPAD